MRQQHHKYNNYNVFLFFVTDNSCYCEACMLIDCELALLTEPLEMVKGGTHKSVWRQIATWVIVLPSSITKRADAWCAGAKGTLTLLH